MLGITFGVVVALGLTGILRSQLFGVGAQDPAIFLVVPSLLAATALLAVLVPVSRAVRVDPTVVLRQE